MIVVDTQAFVWWTHDRRKLSNAALRALSSADRIVISTITCWEIAMLVSKGRFVIGTDSLTWLQESLSRGCVEAYPLPLEAAVHSAEFQQFHDPADQMIVATALYLGVPLVTKDKRIRDANIVQTIW